MKKLLALIVAIIAAIGSGYAQNANRSGFFMEAGIGGLVGNTLRTSVSIKDNVIQYRCLSGMAGDFGLGYRLRFKRHWAYEIKAECLIPFKRTIDYFVPRLLPLGFRYTSVELRKNYSLYAHFNVGGGMCRSKGMLRHGYTSAAYNYSSHPLYPEYKYIFNTLEIGDETFVACYSIGIGANITTHLYAEICWDGNILFDSYGKKRERGTVNGGVMALVIGYRF